MPELELLVSAMMLAAKMGMFGIHNHYGFLKADEEISDDVNKIEDYENNLKIKNPVEYYLSFLGRKSYYVLLRNLESRE